MNSSVESGVATEVPREKLVPAVVKAVRLLDSLAAARKPLTVSQIARQLVLPVSTAKGLCDTLVEGRAIKRLPNRTYQLSYHVMDWTYGLLKRVNLPVEFVRLWDCLRLPAEETGVLSVLDGSDVVAIACRNGGGPFGLDFRIGTRQPCNCPAAGKALLSALPLTRLREMERAGAFRRLTAKSVVELETLSRQLAQVRRRGYAVDDEEFRPGLLSAAAPVFAPLTGEAVAAVAICLVKADSNHGQRDRACAAVTQLARALSFPGSPTSPLLACWGGRAVSPGYRSRCSFASSISHSKLLPAMNAAEK
jgi:DNA-binding IclR family transcriptional regulator